MRRLLRRPLSLLTAPLAALIIALPVAADSSNNSAVAINTKDGSSVFRLAFSVTRASGTIDSVNTAFAFASCTSCRTVAIAVQVVLVDGLAGTFDPTNQAIAINYACDLCDTLATAYQFVIGGGQTLKLTDEGRHQIAEIRRQLEKLRHSTLSPADLQAQVAALMQQLGQVLSTQLVAVPEPKPDTPPASPSPEGSPDGSAPPGTASPDNPLPPTFAPTPTATASPAASQSPLGSPSASPSPQPSASPNASPSAGGAPTP